MVPSNVYSKALYDLAEEIDKNEGCVTCSSVLVEGAAERIDMQTLTIRGLDMVETSVPAIVFYPAGSLGEEVQP